MKITAILTFILLLTFCANGQELPAVKLQDTSAVDPRILDPEYLNSAFSLSLPLSMHTIPERDTNEIYSPSLLSLQYGQTKPEQNFDLSSIWKREIIRQEDYKTLQIVLGSIQAGGTAYLLYRHLKKYGLK
ncbi:MAG: hypothetical protein JXA06_13545 [Bacteroidetes bacterium]|nr:hypothetical protein [Bacteroidota bacterium]